MIQLKELPTSHTSTYVNDAFYERILTLRDEVKSYGLSTSAHRARAETLLFHEARLIDDGRHDEWLDMFAEECLYWVPSDDSDDPRRRVAIAFDDRRRLEERVVRLHTGYAHNQIPHRSLQRHISNVEAWAKKGTGELRVLSKQLVFEYRPSRPLVSYACKVDHRFIKERGKMRIAEKRVVILQAKDPMETPTLL